MRSTFSKNVGFWDGHFFQKSFFRERGRRGRSRRENSGKILATAFSRRDFLMVFGMGWGSGGPDANFSPCFIAYVCSPICLMI